MRHAFADLRYAWRGLRRAPIFTTVAVLSIALGIGANTAIFTLLDQVALRLLPVKEARQLVLLTSSGSFPGSVSARSALSYPAYAELRDAAAAQEVFSGLFCRFGVSMHASVDGRTDALNGELVSGSYFPVLGVGSAIGRTIGPDDDARRGGHPVAVLSYAYWTSRFGRDPSIVGRTIRLNDQPMTIIGVAQAGFDGTHFDNPPQVYVPIAMKAQITPGWDDLDNRRSKWVSVFARLRAGVSAEQADGVLQPVYRAMVEREIGDGVFATASADAIAGLRRSRLHVQSGSQGRLDARLGLARPLWVLMASAAVDRRRSVHA